MRENRIIFYLVQICLQTRVWAHVWSNFGNYLSTNKHSLGFFGWNEIKLNLQICAVEMLMGFYTHQYGFKWVDSL